MEAVEPLREARDVAEARLLRALVDKLPALISYCGPDHRLVFANATYADWFGLSADRIRGIHIRELVGDEVYALNLPYFEKALAGEDQHFDRTLVDKSGQLRHTQASFVPDVVDGEVMGVFVLVIDVTARVEAKQSMDEAQSVAGIGSWEWDRPSGEIHWSTELYRIFGFERGQFELTPDALIARVHPDDESLARGVWDRAVQSGEEYTSDYRLSLPDGSVREVHSRGRPVTDGTGTVVRIVGTLEDVTDAKAAAAELARVNTELNELNELNADVLGMLGHDVRGPLTVVLGYLEELDEAWADSTETVRKEHVATARAAAIRLRTLVDDILALASVESGTIVAEPSDHDLALLVAEALSEVPGESEIAVEGDATLTTWCDAFHVRQIVANLASNALRYGAPPIAITLSAGDDTVDVRVADHGPGVPVDFAPNLFDRFARGPDRRAARGSGLGLYIAGRLAAANHGTLGYTAGPDGRGAIFTLTLPRYG